MGVHDGCIMKHFLRRQPECNQGARNDPGRSKRAEEVEWTREISQQKANGGQVKKDAKSTRNPVVGGSTLTGDITNRDFAHRSPIPRSQRWDEAVQLAVKRYLVDDFAPISFERRAEIVDIHAAELRHESIRASRRHSPEHEVIDALLAPSADDVVPLADLFDECGYVVR